MKHKPIITSLTILLLLVLGIGITVAQEPEPGGEVGAQATVGTGFTYQGRLGLLLGSLLAPTVGPASAPRTSGPARLSPDEAIAAAVNDLELTADGYRLRQPYHVATFTSAGVEVAPESGGPVWTWHLVSVTAGDRPLAGVEVGAVRPVHEQALTVAYRRGGLVEQYLARKKTIEQQFLIPGPLPLAGADLVIAGAVSSAGNFEETEDGWRWRTDDGAVGLGDVRVYDATGRAVPARMTVTAEATRIAVDGAALASAAYPVTIDPEIGANDFRLSDMGPDGNADYDANYPAVAYNSTNDEYLVVWDGDDDTGDLVNDEDEIWGQRVDAVTGAEIGADFRISNMGLDGDADYDARDPAVAYNSQRNEYLVVWWGDDVVDYEYEIFGQRVDAATGAEIGADFRISNMGSDGNFDYWAHYPAVAYNSTDDEYLVVWQGDDGPPLANNEYEIWGQRVDAATGAEIDVDFRLSDMGPDEDADYGARHPDVAYNSTDNEYLVVWEGDDDTAPLVEDEYEIYGQRLSANGTAVGDNDFRLSNIGPVGDADYDAFYPAVAYNSTDNEYLVVWEGDDDTAPLVEDENEIFGQRVDAATGAEIGADFRISNMGPDGNAIYDAYYPAVAYNSTDDEYLVVWEGDDDTGDLVNGEFEIWGRRLNASAEWLDADQLRLSDMGPDGDGSYYDARHPAAAYNSTDDEYLVVWDGDDGGVPNEYDTEIFGQRFTNGYMLYLPLVVRDYE
jgi:hypothetical protein